MQRRGPAPNHGSIVGQVSKDARKVLPGEDANLFVARLESFGAKVAQKDTVLPIHLANVSKNRMRFDASNHGGNSGYGWK